MRPVSSSTTTPPWVGPMILPSGSSPQCGTASKDQAPLPVRTAVFGSSPGLVPGSGWAKASGATRRSGRKRMGLVNKLTTEGRSKEGGKRELKWILKESGTDEAAFAQGPALEI